MMGREGRGTNDKLINSTIEFSEAINLCKRTRSGSRYICCFVIFFFFVKEACNILGILRLYNKSIIRYKRTAVLINTFQSFFYNIEERNAHPMIRF